MTGGRSTNPFDDSFANGPVAGGGQRGGSTNPFDDGDDNTDVLGGGNSRFGVGVQAPPAAYPQEDDGARGIGDVPEDDDKDDDGDAPPEASWQFLGDLPYRRVPLYKNVKWGSGGKGSEGGGGANASDDGILNSGLAAFPPGYLSTFRRPDGLLDARDVRELLSTTTVTKVAGCPNGGPIAAITLPTTGSLPTAGRAGSSGVGQQPAGPMSSTELRIMTSSGRNLSSVEFPPPSLALNARRLYSAADVLTIGFTDRTVLVMVLRDSLCLCYDLRGNLILPPFHVLPGDTGPGNKSGMAGVELLEATVFGGGVAVLSANMNAAVVELLDEHDDPTYADAAHLASRKILPNFDKGGGSASAATGMGEMFGGARGAPPPPNFAIVTPLPTAKHASNNYYSYCTLAVLPRNHTTSGHPELFLSTSDNSVIIVDVSTTDITDVDCRSRVSSPILSMSFAPNGRFLACFTRGSILTVISTSFETKVLDFDTSEGSASPPRDMKWCGEDSVVLHWKNLGVLMVGPYGDWLRFPFEHTENLHIIPEIDCCRIVTDASMEILQRVPPTTALLLQIGSIEPSAMLLDAADAFESGSPSSDEAARAITKTGMLNDAIETCTEAAEREFDVPMQKRLLGAASYGMHFAYKDLSDRDAVMGGSFSGDLAADNKVKPSATAIKFVSAAKKLRVLNALRDPVVGFSLTSSQFDAITPTGVVARLVAMKRPALATSIATYLGLDRLVRAYARASKAAAFVSSDGNHTDTQTAEAATRIINGDGIGGGDVTKNAALNRGAYATVALAADRAGRSGVATQLLMLERSVTDKVPALIAIGSYADAAAVATDARDTDLIFLTLMEFEKACMASTSDGSKSMSNFLNSIVNKFSPESFNLLRVYFSSIQDVKYVMNLLLRGQKHVAAGSTMAKRALAKPQARERQKDLKEASRVFGLGKESAFQKSCTDDYLELLSDQEVLRNKYDSKEVAPETSSITATIFSIIRFAGINRREAHRILADAEKIAKKFRVPEKRLWHVKVRAFAESDQWANLRNLADSKTKPPIGFKPFALAAIKGKQGISEIMRYVDKVPQLEDRYDLFCEAKLWKLALEEAARLKDGRRVMHVRSLCNSLEIQKLCDQVMSRL